MFCFCKDQCYRMPVFFGGSDYDATYEATAFDALTVSFVQETSREALNCYLPAGFTLLTPTITYEYAQFRNVNFLAGGAYNIFQASLPVHFEGKKDSLDGVLPLVIWENNTIPILGGREESGMPKIYADISDITTIDGSYFSSVSFHGNTFLDFDVSNLRPCPESQFSSLKASYANINAIGLRYIPHVGGPGADLLQLILYPQSIVPYRIYNCEGSLNWTKLLYKKGLIHSIIVEQLSSLPLLSMSNPTLTKGKVIMRSPLCRVIK
ncbi:MAG: acetoacetate decarboxylase family protein [bacterium]|nr:acetoacetate decarboxylase family protein [bacterium]